MAIRGEFVIECDQKTCHAEIVIAATSEDVESKQHGLTVDAFAHGWRITDDGEFVCPHCAAPDDRDEAYERAAARARNNDFAETGGRDWT